MEYLYLKIIIVSITFIFFVAVFITYHSKVLELKGFDNVAKKECEVVLKCKLQRSILLGFNKAGEKVNFYLEDKLIGSAVSDKNGNASITTTFNQNSVVQVKIELDSNSKYTSDDAYLSVGVYDDKPVVICDIDHTVCDTKILLFFFKRDRFIPVIKGSPKSLRKISEVYNIIYVTHRDNAFLHRTKRWLKMFGYPQGPIFFWSFGKVPFSSSKFKEETIHMLNTKLGCIAAGIGDKTGDVLAYHTNGLKGILYSKDKRNLPVEIMQFSNWPEIEDYLLKNRDAICGKDIRN